MICQNTHVSLALSPRRICRDPNDVFPTAHCFSVLGIFRWSLCRDTNVFTSHRLGRSQLCLTLSTPMRTSMMTEIEHGHNQSLLPTLAVSVENHPSPPFLSHLFIALHFYPFHLLQSISSDLRHRLISVVFVKLRIRFCSGKEIFSHKNQSCYRVATEVRHKQRKMARFGPVSALL